MSIGEVLADARRQAGLTVTEVSQQTRIRESIIRRIEQDDFAGCGGDFYARGHIRSIATVVGTDPVPLVREYDAAHGPPGPRAAEVFEPSRPVRIRDRRSPSLSLIVALVLLAIIGYGAYRLVSAHDGSRPAAAASHRPTPSATPTPRPTASATSTPAPSHLVIKLTANADCWVQVTKRRDGSQIYMGVLTAGQSKTWTEKQAVEVRLGNPAGVVLTVNGKRQNSNSTVPVTLSFSPGTSSRG